MLTLSNLQKRQNKKLTDPDASIELPKAILLSSIRARGRTVAVEKEKEPPTKILTISDLPRRNRVRAIEGCGLGARSAPTTRVPGGLFAEWEPDEYLGPKVFADCMPNGAWKNQRCFIIGGGPSIKRLDLSVLSGELTIGINRAYELLNPSILYGVDSQLFGWAELGKLGEESRKKFNSYTGFKVWMALHKIFPDDIYLIDPDKDEGYRIGTTRRLAFKSNGGYGAINLAAALGANPIYLLGFDMMGDKQGKQKWWHDGYPMDYGEGVYLKYIKDITNFAPVLKTAGFKVVNLNKKSALKCFSFSTLGTVLKSKKAKAPPANPWVLVSFYTVGTSYEEEIKKLEVSLKKYKIPYHFFPCNPVGTWRGNLNHKSEIILKAFDMFPGQDIVFVDSDAIVRKRPKLFTELSRKHDHDMAAHFHKYSTSVKDGSLLSGTLWFANSQRSRRLVRLWHKIGVEQPTVRHQHCLNIAINDLKAEGVETDVFHMPKEYTQVFDYPGNKPADAVIEHFQASRRFRKEVGKGGPLMDSDSFTP